jgi:hypothetical protein
LPNSAVFIRAELNQAGKIIRLILKPHPSGSLLLMKNCSRQFFRTYIASEDYLD